MLLLLLFLSFLENSSMFFEFYCFVCFISSNAGDKRDVYLQLSVTVLAAFCRVPEIASSKDMVSKIPLILEIMLKE